MLNFAAIDFETANQHRSSICSVGVVFVENGEIVDTFYELIKPTPHFYCRWATEIHGITLRDTAFSDEFPEVWAKLMPRIAGLPLVAHNSPFDEGCLSSVLAAYNLPKHQNAFYCTCRKSRQMFPQLPNHQLKTVSAHVGFNLNNHHHALADAEACARIALKVF